VTTKRSAQRSSVLATVDPSRWLNLSKIKGALSKSIQHFRPRVWKLLQFSTLAYAAVAGATSMLTWLATLQPSFSLYALVPFTYRVQRRLHALALDHPDLETKQSQPAPAVSKDALGAVHRAKQKFADTVLKLLLETPGMPPDLQVQVHVERVPAKPAYPNEPEFVFAIDDGPLFQTRCVQRIAGPVSSETENPSSFDVYVSAEMEPALIPAALSHALAHGVANHAAEALSALFYGAVPLSAWRPRCLVNMIAPASLAARWGGGTAVAAHWVVDTLQRFRAPLVALCMRPVQRRNEFEADLIAATILARIGLDPASMLELLRHAEAGTTLRLTSDDNGGRHAVHAATWNRDALPWARYPSIQRRRRSLEPHMERLKRLEALVQKSEGARNRRIAVLRDQVQRELARFERSSRSAPQASTEQGRVSERRSAVSADASPAWGSSAQAR
jgi:Zn-dependent protease with chaperone function